MFYNIVRFFWPDLTDHEIKKFGILSMTFFFTIGTYWTMRPFKDGIFFNTVGKFYQPRAKIISVFVVMIMVFIYSKLVDLVPRHRLFYIIGSFYTAVFSFLTFRIGYESLGTDIGAHRWFGWLTYFAIESFGTLIVALFWSFVVSITDSESAKKGFPFIIAGAQLGAIMGPILAINAHTIGMQWLMFIATACIMLIMVSIYYFMREFPGELIREKKENKKKPKTGFFEGLRLIVTRPYLFGIFAMVLIYESVTTIIDYQMKIQAQALPEYSTTEGFTRFLGIFGVCNNTMAFLIALLGTSYLIKRYGITFCLLIFPISLGCAVAYLSYAFNFGHLLARTELWITFGVMMIAKGLSYALNNPAKDMMYIPTSQDAKFKSKGWIDMFGNRAAKATGSVFNDLLKANKALLLQAGALLSLGLIGVWIMIALYIGRMFTKLTKEGKIIK